METNDTFTLQDFSKAKPSVIINKNILARLVDLGVTEDTRLSLGDVALAAAYTVSNYFMASGNFANIYDVAGCYAWDYSQIISNTARRKILQALLPLLKRISVYSAHDPILDSKVLDCLAYVENYVAGNDAPPANTLWAWRISNCNNRAAVAIGYAACFVTGEDRLLKPAGTIYRHCNEVMYEQRKTELPSVTSPLSDWKTTPPEWKAPSPPIRPTSNPLAIEELCGVFPPLLLHKEPINVFDK